MSVSIRQQLTQLNRLFKEGDEIYHRISAGMGLSDSTLMILYGLCQSDHPCTQKELCDTWSLKKQTIHSALSNLVQAGYIHMKPSPENSRIKLVILTTEGKEFIKKTAIPLLKAEEIAFERFTAKEREMLLTLNQKHVDLLQEEADRLLQWYNSQQCCTSLGDLENEKRKGTRKQDSP